MQKFKIHLLSLLFFLCGTASAEDFVHVRDGHFYVPEESGAPFCFNGANIDLRLLKAVRGQHANRKALKQELETLHNAGCDVLRVQAGPDTVRYDAAAAWCGELPDDTLLTDIDYLMHEAEKNGQRVVLCLSDVWVADSTLNANATHAVSFNDYIKSILLRKSSEGKTAYTDNPTVFSWEILNEVQSADAASNKWFESRMRETAGSIKAADGNHLLALGCRLDKAKRNDLLRFENLNAISGFGYFSTQIHPILDKWSSFSGLYTALPNIYVRTQNYLAEIERIARKYNRPLVISGFSYPRDRHYLTPGTSSVARNSFFRFLANHFNREKKEAGSLSGIMFWHWNGITTSPLQENLKNYFQQGDTYGIYDVDAETLQSITTE